MMNFLIAGVMIALIIGASWWWGNRESKN